MNVYRSLDEFKGVSNAVVTTGTFDGVHYGHQKIIRRLNEVARAVSGESVILTFFPHPRLVLYPEDNNLKLLNTLNEKIALLEELGVDHLIIIPFTREFSRLSSLQFIRDILIDCIRVKKLIIGYDHHFGRNREGSFAHLKQYAGQYGFEVEEIPEQDVNDVAVSSTKIRNALLEGDIKTANIYLGYTYSIEGKVTYGEGFGRKLGYPTANLEIPETYKLIPREGIYAVKVFVQNDSKKGMLYIGKRPTLNGITTSIEVHIFDMDENLYDQNLRVELLHYVRGDKKLESLDELKKWMQKDEATIREQLKDEKI